MLIPRWPNCSIPVITPDGPGTAVDGFAPDWARVVLDSGPKRNYRRNQLQEVTMMEAYTITQIQPDESGENASMPWAVLIYAADLEDLKAKVEAAIKADWDEITEGDEDLTYPGLDWTDVTKLSTYHLIGYIDSDFTSPLFQINQITEVVR